jgi:hypothetical protein
MGWGGREHRLEKSGELKKLLLAMVCGPNSANKNAEDGVGRAPGGGTIGAAQRMKPSEAREKEREKAANLQLLSSPFRHIHGRPPSD